MVLDSFSCVRIRDPSWSTRSFRSVALKYSLIQRVRNSVVTHTPKSNILLYGIHLYHPLLLLRPFWIRDHGIAAGQTFTVTPVSLSYHCGIYYLVVTTVHSRRTPLVFSNYATIATITIRSHIFKVLSTNGQYSSR